jgi:hypothetical protein
MATAIPPSDAIAALNSVLSEVIDVVQDVKQADRKVPPDHALHTELDRLFDDLRSWAQLLMEEDEELGVSPLASMPSTAGRTPPNLWPTTPSDDEVRHTIFEFLERLAEHVTAALAQQDDDVSRNVLGKIQRDLSGHLEALSEA